MLSSWLWILAGCEALCAPEQESMQHMRHKEMKRSRGQVKCFPGHLHQLLTLASLIWGLDSGQPHGCCVNMQLKAQ